MRKSFVALTLTALACSPAAAPPNPQVGAPVASIAPPPSTPAFVAGPPPEEPEQNIPVVPTTPTRSVTEAALAEWSRVPQCKDFDYFPKGGLRNFWCHRPERVTFAALKALAGGVIFASGPHKDDDLTLDAKADFGHYAPGFVKWLLDNGPSERGSLAQEVTQTTYDSNLRPLARIFWQTHVKLAGDPTCAAREKKAYAQAIASRTLPKNYYERWFFFMNPFFCDKNPHKQAFYFDNGMDAGIDGNVTKTVVGFWLRRQMDGTEAGFVEGLRRLVTAYDPTVLAFTFDPPDTTAVERALADAVKTTAACKAPGETPRATFARIEIAPSGRVSAPGLQKQLGEAVFSCVDNALAALKVPAFKGDTLVFDRKLMLPPGPLPSRPRGGGPLTFLGLDHERESAVDEARAGHGPFRVPCRAPSRTAVFRTSRTRITTATRSTTRRRSTRRTCRRSSICAPT